MPQSPTDRNCMLIAAAMDHIVDGRASRRPSLEELYQLNLSRENDLRVPLDPWGDEDTRDQVRADVEYDRAAEAREERQ